MRQLLQVFRFEFIRQGRRRGFLFVTFGLPLIAVLLFLGYQLIQRSGSNDSNVSADTEETTGIEMSAAGYVDYSQQFGEPGLFGTGGQLVRFETEEEAQAAMDSGDIGAYFVIGADYLETGDVTRYVPQFGLDNMFSANFFEAFMVNKLLDGTNPDVVNRLENPMNLTENLLVTASNGDAVGTEEAQNEGASFILVYAFSFMLLFGTFSTSGYLMRTVLEEKETRMVEVLMSTVKPRVLLAGKVLAFGLLGMIQIAAWMITVVFLLSQAGSISESLGDINVPPAVLFWTVLYFIFGYLFFASAYAVIGSISPSMREGPQFAVFITLPAVLPIYFIGIFTETPNATLPVIMSMVPITAPMAMVQRLVMTNVPVIELLISLSLLALAGVLMTWFAARLFRVTTLLAGQMPRLRDLVQLVRES